MVLKIQKTVFIVVSCELCLVMIVREGTEKEAVPDQGGICQVCMYVD